MQMRSQMALSAEEQEVLWWLLQRHAAASTVATEGDEGAAGGAGEPCLNYDEFTQARAARVSKKPLQRKQQNRVVGGG